MTIFAGDSALRNTKRNSQMSIAAVITTLVIVMFVFLQTNAASQVRQN